MIAECIDAMPAGSLSKEQSNISTAVSVTEKQDVLCSQGPLGAYKYCAS
jgi:hypothetical protein